MSWEKASGKYATTEEDKGGFSSLYKEKRKVVPTATNYKCQKCLQVTSTSARSATNYKCQKCLQVRNISVRTEVPAPLPPIASARSAFR